MEVPLPELGFMAVIHEGAPVTLQDVQLVLMVNDVEPLGEPTVILAGDTVKIGAAVILMV